MKKKATHLSAKRPIPAQDVYLSLVAPVALAADIVGATFVVMDPSRVAAAVLMLMVSSTVLLIVRS
jgi:hypothetical protein